MRNGECGMRNLKIGRVIAGGEADDAFCSRQDFLEIDPLAGVPLQVGHFAMLFFSQPLLEFAGVRGWISRGEAAIVKAQLPGALPDGGFHPPAARAVWN